MCSIYCFFFVLLRLYLAALHFNENADRLQATTSSGEPVFRLCFPKYKKGEGTAKPVKTEVTLKYVDDILELVFENVFPDPGPYLQAVLEIPIPDSLSAQFSRPDKASVVSAYVSRFNPEEV